MEVYAPGCNTDHVQNATDATYMQSAFAVPEKHVGIRFQVPCQRTRIILNQFSIFAVGSNGSIWLCNALVASVYYHLSRQDR